MNQKTYPATALNVIPQNWYSWHFKVTDGEKEIAAINMSQWREKGTLQIKDVALKVYRKGWLKGSYALTVDGLELAHAEKPGIVRRTILIYHAQNHYTLTAASVFRRKMLLMQGDKVIGTLAPQGAFSRRMIAELPDALSEPLRIFIIWLALLLWKREYDGSTGG
jgi:hypothetical protein